MLHLTRKVPKLYTADWVARRALGPRADVLQCTRNGSAPNDAGWRLKLADRLPAPHERYDIGVELCRTGGSGTKKKGAPAPPPPCTLLPSEL